MIPQPPAYYVRRPAPAQDFERGFWHAKDPDGVTRNRLQERDLWLADNAEEIAWLRLLPGGRILDVGCGLGFALSALDPAKWERHGVEVSAFAAEYAAEHGFIRRNPLIAGDCISELFDAVTMFHVIEHMQEPEAELREVHRVLKPGGKLLVATPDFDSHCARHFGERFRLLHDPTHISLFSTESMFRFLRDHGFRVTDVRYPYFGMRHATAENLLRVLDTSKVSPPFPGNIMTFYAEKA